MDANVRPDFNGRRGVKSDELGRQHVTWIAWGNASGQDEQCSGEFGQWGAVQVKGPETSMSDSHVRRKRESTPCHECKKQRLSDGFAGTPCLPPTERMPLFRTQPIFRTAFFVLGLVYPS